MKLKSAAKYVIRITIKVIKLKTYLVQKCETIKTTTQTRCVMLQNGRKMNF